MGMRKMQAAMAATENDPGAAMVRRAIQDGPPADLVPRKTDRVRLRDAFRMLDQAGMPDEAAISARAKESIETRKEAGTRAGPFSRFHKWNVTSTTEMDRALEQARGEAGQQSERYGRERDALRPALVNRGLDPGATAAEGLGPEYATLRAAFMAEQAAAEQAAELKSRQNRVDTMAKDAPQLRYRPEVNAYTSGKGTDADFMNWLSTPDAAKLAQPSVEQGSVDGQPYFITRDPDGKTSVKFGAKPATPGAGKDPNAEFAKGQLGVYAKGVNEKDTEIRDMERQVADLEAAIERSRISGVPIPRPDDHLSAFRNIEEAEAILRKMRSTTIGTQDAPGPWVKERDALAGQRDLYAKAAGVIMSRFGPNADPGMVAGPADLAAGMQAAESATGFPVGPGAPQAGSQGAPAVGAPQSPPPTEGASAPAAPAGGMTPEEIQAARARLDAMEVEARARRDAAAAEAAGLPGGSGAPRRTDTEPGLYLDEQDPESMIKVDAQGGMSKLPAPRIGGEPRPDLMPMNLDPSEVGGYWQHILSNGGSIEEFAAMMTAIRDNGGIELDDNDIAAIVEQVRQSQAGP